MIVTGRDTSPLLFENGDEIDIFKFTQFSFIVYTSFYFITNVSHRVIKFLLYLLLTVVYSKNLLFCFGAVKFTGLLTSLVATFACASAFI